MCGKGGHAWQKGGMHGRGHVWQRGACMAGGVWQGEHAWQGACMVGGCVWQGACMAGGMHGKGVCVAGEMATAADGTHLTGMHSCFKYLCTNMLITGNHEN